MLSAIKAELQSYCKLPTCILGVPSQMCKLRMFEELLEYIQFKALSSCISSSGIYDEFI